MAIRRIKESDIESVAEMYRDLVIAMRECTQDPYLQFATPSVNDFLQVVNASLESPDRPIFVAVQKKKIVGFIAGEYRTPFFPLAPVKQVGYISAAYVVPEARRAGILKQLHKAISHYFSKNKVDYIELNVLSPNSLGEAAWQSLGYECFRKQLRLKI